MIVRTEDDEVVITVVLTRLILFDMVNDVGGALYSFTDVAGKIACFKQVLGDGVIDGLASDAAAKLFCLVAGHPILGDNILSARAPNLGDGEAGSYGLAGQIGSNAVFDEVILCAQELGPPAMMLAMDSWVRRHAVKVLRVLQLRIAAKIRHCL